MNSDEVGADDEVVGIEQGVIRESDGFGHRCRRGGVKGKDSCRDVVTLHFHAVDPDDETVITEGGELEGTDVRKVRHDERPPQKDGRVPSLHVRELSAAGIDIAVPEGCRSVGKGGIAEIDAAPRSRVWRGSLVDAFKEPPVGTGVEDQRGVGLCHKDGRQRDGCQEVSCHNFVSGGWGLRWEKTAPQRMCIRWQSPTTSLSRLCSSVGWC